MVCCSFPVFLDGLVDNLSYLSSFLQAPQTYTNAGQAKICQAYKKFAEQHETLMDILITKANVVGSLIAGPFRYSLQQDEKILDNFIFQVIDAVPSCAIEVIPFTSTTVSFQLPSLSDSCALPFLLSFPPFPGQKRS